MKHARVFRNSRRRRRYKRSWKPLLAGLVLIAGTALVGSAIYRLTTPNEEESSAPEGGSMTTATTAPSGVAIGPTTTAKPTASTTTYGTSFVMTTSTTKATTARPATPQGENVEGHFVQDRNTAPWNLVLANPWNPLPEGFDDKLELKGNLKGYSHEKVDVRAYEALKQLLADGAKYNLSICSGHRTVEKQRSLFEGRVKKWMDKGYSRAEAEKEVLKDTAYPGTSEHNTGLAADLLGGGYTWLSESFAETEAYKWLINNCASYGFILRYPKGRQDITGYTFEPWHYRYVGKEAATYIMEHNLTLEEYLEQQAG